MPTPILIISGYNTRGIIAYCRFFSANYIPFYIVSAGKDDLINLTTYKENIIFERKNATLSIDDFNNYKSLLPQTYKEIIILPSTEFLNRFILKNKDELKKLGYTIPLVDESLYAKISDKYAFGELCKKYNIDIPKEYENHQGIPFPFVAKPKTYFVNNKIVNKKPFLVHNEDDYQNLLEELKDGAEYFFQEFITGDSFYLLFYFDQKGRYTVFSQQNFVQQDLGLSIIAAKSSDFHQQEITKKYVQLFQKEKFHGLVMVELKINQEKACMIEANPRIWGPSQLILDAGMDLMYRFALDWNLIKQYETPKYRTKIPYFWSGGINADKRNNRNLAFHTYNESLLKKDYLYWDANNVYKRNDCLQIYHLENETDNEK